MSENILWYLITGTDAVKYEKTPTTIGEIATKIDENKIGEYTRIGWMLEKDKSIKVIDITTPIKNLIAAVSKTLNGIDDTDTNSPAIKQNNSDDKTNVNGKSERNISLTNTTIICFAITASLLIGSLFGFICSSISSNTDIGDKFDKFKNIAEALKENLESKTDSLVSFPSKLNKESTAANTSMTNLNKLSSELTTELNTAKGITDSVMQQATNVFISIKDLNEIALPQIEKLKILSDAESFNKTFKEILTTTLNTDNLAKIIVDKDPMFGKKFLASLTEALLPKGKKDVDNLTKIFIDKIGDIGVDGKKQLITAIFNSFNTTDSETKNKLAQDLVKGLIDKGSLQQAIAKVVAPSKRKAIIIPTQDFNPATKDKALFIELMKKLLAKKQIAPDELKVFIDRNGRLVEINEENKVNVLNENFNDVISNINGATINDFLNSTESKYDCVFIRGPDSSVKPEIVNAVWFNGNRCSVIYTVKGKVTNDDYPRLNQWRNLTILNQGKLRLTILKDTESANDSADSIIKEIDGIN